MNSENVKQLSNEELSFFTGQVALMLKSGIALYESIEVLSENYAGTAFEKAFGAIYEATERGDSLSEAMADSGIFPRYAVKMTSVGESTGKLEQVMQGLSHHYAREDVLASSVKNAVRYPAVLLLIMVVVVLVLNIKVLPLFENVLTNLGGVSSNTTRITMKIGTGIGIFALVVVLALLAIAAVLTLMIKRGKKHVIIEKLTRIAPAIGRLEKAIAAERFLSVLAISLEAGYPPESAAEACAELIDDKDAVELIKGIAKTSEETGSLCDAICGSGLLEPLKARMIKVGFMTGRQDEVTESVAQLYAGETDEKLEKLLALIEPALVTTLAVIIGCILLTIMLPLAGVLSSFL